MSKAKLDELKKQNKLIIKYLTEIQENQNAREKEQKQLTTASQSTSNWSVYAATASRSDSFSSSLSRLSNSYSNAPLS
jgi:hypothetical protein